MARAFGILLLIVVAYAAAAQLGNLQPTPSTGTGPFYPPDDTPSVDNDLLRLAADDRAAAGTPLTIDGVVRSTDGTLLEGVEVILWQTDAEGNYQHSAGTDGFEPDGEVGLDSRFQYWGKATTGSAGDYTFETIVPGGYSFGGTPRPKHVHFRFRKPGYRTLDTELNFLGDPRLDGDFVTSGFTREQLAMINIRLTEREGGGKAARFDIVMRAQ